jgi:hypothetical protein
MAPHHSSPSEPHSPWYAASLRESEGVDALGFPQHGEKHAIVPDIKRDNDDRRGDFHVTREGIFFINSPAHSRWLLWTVQFLLSIFSSSLVSFLILRYSLLFSVAVLTVLALAVFILLERPLKMWRRQRLRRWRMGQREISLPEQVKASLGSRWIPPERMKRLTFKRDRLRFSFRDNDEVTDFSPIAEPLRMQIGALAAAWGWPLE